MKRIGILVTHPVQYLSAFFKEIAKEFDLTVYYCIKPNKEQQAGEFGIGFNWDLPLLQGYNHEFLTNISAHPDTDTYFGLDTPGISDKIKHGKFGLFIIFGWYYKSAHQALAACNKYGVPVYARGDSNLLSGKSGVRLLKKLYFKNFLDKFNGFLSPGERFKEYLRFYGISKDRIIFCPHFVDNDFFRSNRLKSRQEITRLRSEFGIAPDDLVFLFCGKLVRRKRPLDLLEALVVLKNKDVPARAVIIGDGALKENLEQYSKEHGLNIIFLGFQNQRALPEIYSISDSLVLPSDGSETWGLVVNEAFACGIPAIISNRVGCGADMIDDGITGYIYRCGDINNLVTQIMRFKQAKESGFSFAPLLEKKLETYCIGKAIESIKNILL